MGTIFVLLPSILKPEIVLHSTDEPAHLKEEDSRYDMARCFCAPQIAPAITLGSFNLKLLCGSDLELLTY